MIMKDRVKGFVRLVLIVLISSIFVPITFLSCCQGFSLSSQPSTKSTQNGQRQSQLQEESFSVPLVTARPEPETVFATLNRLWMDPRPVTTLVREALANRKTSVQSRQNVTETTSTIDTPIAPYCVVSEEFVVGGEHRFRVSLFPRGRLAADSTESVDPVSKTGPAAAYLQYISQNNGDEVDVGWKLTLVDAQTDTPLAIATAGGLPRSNTTWSAAMTFCTEAEALESCGRAADWGSSAWSTESVCEALRSGKLEARGSITVYGSRSGENSLIGKGAVQAALQSAADASKAGRINTEDIFRQPYERSFRVGEVIVPVEGHSRESELEEAFVSAGTDYRIMTMAAPDGTPIFSTDDVSPQERKDVRLALRPCGWKLQQQVWQQQHEKQKRQDPSSSTTRSAPPEWPVEIPAGWLSTSAKSRFNPSASLPRLKATFQRDATAVILGIALALLPLPGALIGRNFVSLYAIPSASMDPTLMKGDVLLVEKFPGVDGRIHRGEIVLFRPPSALEEIASASIKGNSLFVKRVVGMPGDSKILLDEESGTVTLNGGMPAPGPDRTLCSYEREPVKLIDRFLKNGKGKSLDILEQDDFYVLGDCKAVSIDSRVFGVLPREKIEGRPLGRIWPPERITWKEL